MAQKQRYSFIHDLSCPSCGSSYPVDHIQTYCLNCNAPLVSNYDLITAKKVLDRDQISQRSKGMYRWHELLPVLNTKNIISLGEGDTPMLHLPILGKTLGFSSLYIKDEGLNPTGSFKARGLSAAVSKGKELGITKMVMPSAGNAGGALAAYAARGEIEALIYMPKSSPRSNYIESEITGAQVELVDGLISDAAKYADEKARTEAWFNVSTFKEPYRVEGKKIIGYEIAESLGWKLPNVIIYPTGGGTGLVGMWKAFKELDELGWLESSTMPRMVSVQAEGCAPIVSAFKSGKDSCEFWLNAHTIATGLCVPKSFADRQILQVIRYSQGTAVSVSDEDIVRCRKQIAEQEGIFTCPEGAATLAGLENLINEGWLQSDETIIIFNTGSGLKYIC